MTDQELEELITDCPVLFHMAERGSWEAIEERGLLSTSAILDLYSIQGIDRARIERTHRSSGVEVNAEGLPRAVIRDQIPMSDAGLRRCLPTHMSPADWYEILNSKTFFWLTEDRLHRMMCAKPYRNHEHEVLEVHTRSLVEAHREVIWLCPINSGCTRPNLRKRDESLFARIAEYPYSYWRKRRRRGERVVELAVDYAVRDIHKHVRRVLVKKGKEVVSLIWCRSLSKRKIGRGTGRPIADGLDE